MHQHGKKGVVNPETRKAKMSPKTEEMYFPARWLEAPSGARDPTRRQCSGSGSVPMFLGLSDPHPDPLVTRTNPDPDPSLFS